MCSTPTISFEISDDDWVAYIIIIFRFYNLKIIGPWNMHKVHVPRAASTKARVQQND